VKRRALFAGIDVGSLSTDVVVLCRKGTCTGSAIVATGASTRRAAADALARAVSRAGGSMSDIACTVATGYGRERVFQADHRITEITCHARGASHQFPGARTVIDVGGQDSKVIRLWPDGRVADFAMNDKCAAGTGRFLEVMARALEMDLEELGPRALLSRKALDVSATCTVFAESEVISLIAAGAAPEDIAWGIHRAVADRIAALAERVGIAAPAVMTGGVAKNPAVCRSLEERLGILLLRPDDPQLAGALGAALIARDRGSDGTVLQDGPGRTAKGPWSTTEEG
jgi:(R)-2-hydroxyacyl-CoA dehydratese activating ATPase